MNFALFSSGISSVAAEQISEIVGKPLGHIVIAVITTAATPYIQRNVDLFPDWLNDDVANIKEYGFQTRFFTLENLTEDLLQEIKNCDVLYLSGGNVFYLRYWIEKTHFKDVIQYFAEEKLYAGSSAGAIVVTNNIGVYNKLDNPKEAPDVINQGLQLVNAHIIVHWNQYKYKKELELIEEVYKKDIKFETFYLKDGEVLFLKFGEFQQI